MSSEKTRTSQEMHGFDVNVKEGKSTWKNSKPTPVLVPMQGSNVGQNSIYNQRGSRSAPHNTVLNPHDSKTRKAVNKGHNPTARQTVTKNSTSSESRNRSMNTSSRASMTDGDFRASKRQKLHGDSEGTGLITSKYYGDSAGVSNGIGRESNGYAGVTSREYTRTGLEDKDELDLLSNPGSPGEKGYESREARNVVNARNPPEDGESTSRLRQKLGEKTAESSLVTASSFLPNGSGKEREAHQSPQAGLPDDPIEVDADSHEESTISISAKGKERLKTPSGKTPFEKGSVKAKATFFELKAETKEPRHIDFSAPKFSRVSRMKPKLGQSGPNLARVTTNKLAIPNTILSAQLHQDILMSPTMYKKNKTDGIPIGRFVWYDNISEEPVIFKGEEGSEVSRFWLYWSVSRNRSVTLQLKDGPEPDGTLFKEKSFNEKSFRLGIAQVDPTMNADKWELEFNSGEARHVLMLEKSSDNNCPDDIIKDFTNSLNELSSKTAYLRGNTKALFDKAERLALEYRTRSRKKIVSALDDRTVNPPAQQRVKPLARTSTIPVRVQPQRGSMRVLPNQDELRSSKDPPPNADEIVLVYPPTGPGAVNVTVGDLQRLDPGEYLNDSLIELGLKFWMNDLRSKSPDIAESFHIFSSFFYKKLKNRDAKEGYDSVKKWTTKVDLFNKKYIIIPINEHMHWYLAIIYHPEHVLQPPDPKPSPRTSPRIMNNRKTNTRYVGSTRQRNGGEDVGEGEDIDPFVQRLTQSTRVCSLEDVQQVVDDEDEAQVEEVLGTLIGGGSTEVISDSEESSVSVRTDNQPDQLEDDDDNIEARGGEQVRGSESSQVGQIEDAIPDTASATMSEGEPMDVDDFPPNAEEAGTSRSLRVGSEPPSPSKVRVRDGMQPRPSSSVPPPSLASHSVPSSMFYGAAQPSRVHSKPIASSGGEPSENGEGVADGEEEVDQVFDSAAHRTYVFTMDSLGSKHPQAINVLKEYLRMEAKDKKSIEQTSNAVGKACTVPTQPNYCDCGLYLLHFARTFMANPEKHGTMMAAGIKKQESQVFWLGDQVSRLREELKERILKESRIWKSSKVTKDGDKPSETTPISDESKKADQNVVNVESSDDDVVVTEVVSKQTNARNTKKAGKKSADAQAQAGKPMRMRG